MLLNCPSCNARYLVNSVDLKPEGKLVKCALCGHQWFQELYVGEHYIKRQSSPTYSNNQNDYEKKLPSKYINANKPSLLNSILIILLIIIVSILYQTLKKIDGGIINLLYYYIQNTIIKISAAIDSIAKAIHLLLD